MLIYLTRIFFFFDFECCVIIITKQNVIKALSKFPSRYICGITGMSVFRKITEAL